MGKEEVMSREGGIWQGTEDLGGKKGEKTVVKHTDEQRIYFQ